MVGLLSFRLFAAFALLSFLIVSSCSAVVITFDDLHETASGSFIGTGYQGLVWSNFAALNGVLYPARVPFLTNGYFYGTVSASNVALNGFGQAAEIDSAGTNFNFLSVYLTSAWNSNLNIDVQGFRNGSLIYDRIVVVAATNATQITFDYVDIDRLYFNSYGGDPAFQSTVYGGENFAMDNLSIEFVPEPSSLLLAALGSISLAAFLRRKRT